MKKIWSALLIGFILLSPHHAFAELLTLDQAIQEVMSQNANIRADRFHIEASRHKKTQAKSLEDPSVTFEIEKMPWKANGLSESDSLNYRIEQKIPLWSQEITTDLNPLECGLDFAAAENKGCYPGQEVIEKIRSYAQPAKKLVQIKGTGPTPTLPSQLLQSHDKSECGKLTSAIGDGTNWTGLAIVRRSSLSQNHSFQVGDTHVTVLES